MTLYTCEQTDHAASLGHPCGRAARALREAGWEFEIETVKGYRLMPWTRRGNRDEIREISGQDNVPVLVTDAGDVVSGSGAIMRWASANPAPTAVTGS
ncbi:MAG TPA: glutathione S-transferase N-terminal domain-containing protein [Solirubrobacteraceae bacterium]